MHGQLQEGIVYGSVPASLIQHLIMCAVGFVQDAQDVGKGRGGTNGVAVFWRGEKGVGQGTDGRVILHMGGREEVEVGADPAGDDRPGAHGNILEFKHESFEARGQAV